MTTGMGRKRGGRGGAAVDMDTEDVEIIFADEDGDTGDDESVDFTHDGNEPETDATPAPKTEPTDDAFAILKREKDAADAALAAERQKSRDLDARLSAADGDLDATSSAVLKHAAASARNEVKAAQAAFARAMAAHDFEAAGEAQAQISEKTIEAREYETASAEHEREVTARRAAPKTTQQPAPATDDDAKIRASLTPASAEWAIKNKAKVFASQSAWSSTIAAHHKAVEAGYEIDSPAYFEFLEGDLGIKEPAAVTRTTSTKTVKRPPPVAAAPVNKGGTTAAGGSVTLTRAERDSAARMGMTVARYAANKKRALDAANDPDYKGPKYSQNNPAISGRR